VSTTRGSTLWVLAMVLLVSLSELQAQPPQAGSSVPGESGYQPNPRITPDMIEKRSAEVAFITNLNEAAKTRLGELYRKALSSLEAAETYQVRATTFVQALGKAPEQT